MGGGRGGKKTKETLGEGARPSNSWRAAEAQLARPEARRDDLGRRNYCDSEELTPRSMPTADVPRSSRAVSSWSLTRRSLCTSPMIPGWRVPRRETYPSHSAGAARVPLLRAVHAHTHGRAPRERERRRGERREERGERESAGGDGGVGNGSAVRADAPGASTIIASCLPKRGGRPWPRTTIPRLHSPLKARGRW